jgi:hypothetical protein|tara:strand:+ start:18 stop:308 length:291 start_codon:yes stop_codon:yes gene_type:complete
MNKKYLTPKFVLDYFGKRTDEPMRHCHKALAAACNDISDELDYDNPLDMLKLLCFNDEIPSLHTHSYGFHTATGRHIITSLQAHYYDMKDVTPIQK